MLAIHGLWSRGRGLLLWAEDSDRAVRSPSQALRSARAHPFALPADDLATIHPGKPGLATLLLPSVRTAPLDSPELTRVTPRPAPRAGVSLLAWSVPVVRVDPLELDDPVDELRYGASIVHLRALAEFAADLAGRGRVAPGVRVDGPEGAARAIWRPVVTGPDAMAMHALVAAMPPVARAEQAGPHGMAAPTTKAGQDPAALVEDALATLVDAAVRDRLGRAATPIELVPPRRGRRPLRPPAVEAWLAALNTVDGRFDAEPAEVDALADALAPWDELGAEPAGPARATFRLTEELPLHDPADPDPDAPDTVWRLEFLLRSVADPSLLVPAEQVWTAPDGLRRWIDAPQEILLAELAKANAIYPELAGAL
ncbi:MAG: ATP-dependent helicase, partial [Pseudonocardia sp.]|nr:ATP-dependent helicase [Pseudonocardia sp.]